MDSTPELPGNQALNSITPAVDLMQRNALLRRNVALALWLLGLLALLVASAITLFFHPGPWPFDLQTTVTLQSLHYWPWLQISIDFPSRFNDVIPAGIALTLWLAGLLLIGWVFKRRGKSAMLWIVSALFIVIGSMFADLAFNGLISRLVNRPRPSPLLIHVYNPEPVPSFPSGHVEHTVVYYGFLLYLSFTKPVREWRYHWLLLPLQIFAALNILMIGYSRIEEGSHWLTDALAGYLEGAVVLVLLIFLYRWTLKKLEERRANRLVEQAAVVTQAHPPIGETMHEKSLETVHVVGKKMKPSEQLLVKCKEDWIVHLAQALAFSFLMTLVSLAYILLPIYHAILGTMSTQMQRLFSIRLEEFFPAPLSTQITQVFSKALDIFSQAPPLAKIGTILLAVLLGSNLFSLMEACFDVIYHLPPRPFLRRHLVALGMLFLFIVIEPIIILAATTPTLVLSLVHVSSVRDISTINPIDQIATILGSIILTLILFQAIYVLVPSRDISWRTIGLHMRNSWRGTLIATGGLQLSFLLFRIYTSSSLSYYIGDIGFILIALLYFYLFTLILLFGAEINAFFAEGIHVPQNDLITQASKDEFR